MIKFLLTFLILLISLSGSILAQDYIHLRNKEVLKVKKVKQEGDFIYYRDYESGSKQRVPKNRVEFIDFSDGKRIDFSQLNSSINDNQSNVRKIPQMANEGAIEKPGNSVYFGVGGNLALPSGEYDNNKEYSLGTNSESAGFADPGWSAGIYAGYYLSRKFALEGSYYSLRNPTSSDYTILVFYIPLSAFGIDEISRGPWKHQYFLLGPKFSFPIYKSNLDLSAKVGGMYSTEPSLEIQYYNGNSNNIEFSSVPVNSNGVLYSFDFSLRFKLFDNFQLAYNMGYMFTEMEFSQLEYFENGVKYKYSDPFDYKQSIQLFNLGLSLQIMLE